MTLEIQVWGRHNNVVRFGAGITMWYAFENSFSNDNATFTTENKSYDSQKF